MTLWTLFLNRSGERTIQDAGLHVTYIVLVANRFQRWTRTSTAWHTDDRYAVRSKLSVFEYQLDPEVRKRTGHSNVRDGQVCTTPTVVAAHRGSLFFTYFSNSSFTSFFFCLECPSWYRSSTIVTRLRNVAERKSSRALSALHWNAWTQ
jgi:hypothetical protein